MLPHSPYHALLYIQTTSHISHAKRVGGHARPAQNEDDSANLLEYALDSMKSCTRVSRLDG